MALRTVLGLKAVCADLKALWPMLWPKGITQGPTGYTPMAVPLSLWRRPTPKAPIALGYGPDRPMALRATPIL